MLAVGETRAESGGEAGERGPERGPSRAGSREGTRVHEGLRLGTPPAHTMRFDSAGASWQGDTRSREVKATEDSAEMLAETFRTTSSNSSGTKDIKEALRIAEQDRLTAEEEARAAKEAKEDSDKSELPTGLLKT